MMEMSSKKTRRIKRDDQRMKDFAHDLRNNIHVTSTKRHHFFILELKFLFTGMFATVIEYIFYYIGSAYLFVVFRENMREARTNPDGNRMLRN